MNRITLSVACSIDGYMNDASSERLILSSTTDLQDIQLERARHDAVLVGAGTVRADNPSLLVKNPELVRERLKGGLAAQPAKVTITRTGDLNPAAKFFENDGAEKIILCPVDFVTELDERFFGLASVVGVDGSLDALAIVQALEKAGIDNLFVEGGTKVLSMFLSSGTFDDFRLAIAPIFVGAQAAPQLRVPFEIADGDHARLAVTRVRLLGDTTVINFRPADELKDHSIAGYVPPPAVSHLFSLSQNR